MNWAVQKLMSFIQSGMYATGAIVVLGVAALYLKQDSLLYYPAIGDMPLKPEHNPRGYRSPDDHNIPYENCRIKCEDGVTIHGWLLLHKDSLVQRKPTIIFFHGNAGEWSERAKERESERARERKSERAKERKRECQLPM